LVPKHNTTKSLPATCYQRQGSRNFKGVSPLHDPLSQAFHKAEPVDSRSPAFSQEVRAYAPAADASSRGSLAGASAIKATPMGMDIAVPGRMD